MNSNYNQSNSDIQEYGLINNRWIPVIGKYIRMSTTGGSNRISSIELEDLTKIITVIQNRDYIKSKQKPLVTAAREETEFLPLSFLETGERKSLAVCRILTNFSLRGFKALVNQIQELENSNDFDTTEKFKEIFAIPQEIANEIFDPNLKPLEALKNNIDERRLAKINPIPIGTGFLVGGNHLITNHHLLPDREIAEQCVVQFNYVEDASGITRNSINYDLDPRSLFISNKALDYTLVRLKPRGLKQQAGSEFGWIQLIEDDTTISPGFISIKIQVASSSRDSIDIHLIEQKLKNKNEKYQIGTINIFGSEEFIIRCPEKPVGEILKDLEEIIPKDCTQSKKGDSIIIVQHPKGKKKKITLNNNVEYDGLYKEYLRYKPDTDYGSSGSPVFNEEFDLVALHHAATTNLPELRQTVYAEQQQNPPEIEILAGQGIRINCIIKDLKSESFSNPKLRSFIQDFVITSEQLNYPPLPSALEFDGVSHHIDLSEDSIKGIAFATANLGNSEIKLWNQSGLELKTLRTVGVSRISFSPDGKTLALSIDFGSKGEIEVWNLEAQPFKSLSWKADEYGLIGLIFDGQRIASLSGMSPSLKLWSLEGRLLKELSTENDDTWFRDGSFTLDGKILAACGSKELKTGTINLWRVDSEDNKPFKSIEAHGDMAWSVSFSPDSKTLASGGRDSTVKLWSSEDGSLLKNLKGHKNEVRIVRFSPDGNTIASGSSDGTVKLWSLNGKLLQTLGHSDEVQSLSFSSNSQILASGSKDGTVKLWSWENGVLLTTLKVGSSSTFVNLNPKANFLKISDRRVNSNQLYSLGGHQAFTIEAWVNPYPVGEDGAIGQDGTVIGKFHKNKKQNNEVSVGGEYLLSLTKNGQVVFSILNEESEILEFKSEKNLTLGKYSHIAVTYDNQEKTIKLYINGELNNEDKSEGISQIDAFTPLQIGAFLGLSEESNNLKDTNSGLFRSSFFKGIITEVRLWKINRTKDEIRENMNWRLQGTEEGLVGYWRFEEGESKYNEVDKIYNLAYKSKFGINSGARRLIATDYPGLPLSFGFYFNGKNSYIDCGDDKTLDEITNEITVEAWVKHKFDNGFIVSRGGSWGESGYSLSWYQGRIRVELQDTERSVKTIIDTKNLAPNDRLWHHIAFTWSKNSGEIEIYIDGKQQDIICVVANQCESILIDGHYRDIGIFKGVISKSPLHLNIGRFDIDLVTSEEVREKIKKTGHYFNGSIAEVRLWKKALTLEQIKGNMYRRLNFEEEKTDIVGYWRLDDIIEGKNLAVNQINLSKPAIVYRANRKRFSFMHGDVSDLLRSRSAWF